MRTTYFLAILIIIAISSCTELLTTNEILSFKLPEKINEGLQEDYEATINNNEINIVVPYNTPVNNLIPSFETNAMDVKVNNKSQISGNTSNDFSSSLVYTAIAENGSTRDYIVTIKVAEEGQPLSSATNEILSFKFLEEINEYLQEDYEATINNNEINIVVPYNTPVYNLIPSFETNAIDVKVNNNTQISGTTPNDFSSPLIYTAIAENGTVRDYTVTIEVEAGVEEQLQVVSATNVGIVTPKYIDSYKSDPFGWGINLTNNATQFFNAIDIADNNVYVVGENGAFYTESVNSNSIKRYSIDLNFDNIAVKKISNTLLILTNEFLLRSTDNGQSFEKLVYENFEINQLYLSKSNNALYNFYNGKLWKSIDNGSTFTAINSNLPFETDGFNQRYGIKRSFYIDHNNNFWVIAGGKIYVSRDEGITFYNTTSLTDDYNVIYVSPDNNVWVGGHHGNILGVSVDSGKSFNFTDLSSINASAHSVHDIKFSSNSIWLAVGNGNSGLVKINYNDASNINGVYFDTYGTGINSELAIDENGNIWSAESGAIGRNLQKLF